jgi:hypothetical protein
MLAGDLAHELRYYGGPRRHMRHHHDLRMRHSASKAATARATARRARRMRRLRWRRPYTHLVTQKAMRSIAYCEPGHDGKIGVKYGISSG